MNKIATFRLLSVSTVRLNVLAELDSFPLCHYGTHTHTCSLSLSPSPPHTHGCKDTCMQSFMQQIANLKDQSWVPHHISPVMRNRHDHPLFHMHIHPHTHPNWTLARAYILYFIKMHKLDQRQHRARRNSHSCTDWFHCHNSCDVNCICIMASIQPCLESTSKCLLQTYMM